MDMKLQVNRSFAPVNNWLMRRSCPCDKKQNSQNEEEHGKRLNLQRRSPARITSAPSIIQDVLRSAGEPLDIRTRTFMEPRFGHDFGRVRVHTDARAVESARAVDALAYTVGQDMVFGAGQYAPGTHDGQRLLAHELTHVVQQSTAGSAGSPGAQRQTTEEEKQKPAPEAGTNPSAAEATDTAGAPPASDADIDALDLAATAKAAAQELKKKHPEISFTSGRRTVAEQAHAMASKIVSGNDRKWIEKTYSSAASLQKWVDDNPKATTVDEIARGLEETMKGMSESNLGKVSKHLSGEAFDVQPQEKDADVIKKDINALPGLSKFLEKEGGLVRWHAQFKRVDQARDGYDQYEQEADRMADQVIGKDYLSAEVLRSPGKPLDPAVRKFVEPRFGQDLSAVRVHTDSNASESANDLNAIAYTAGQHIVFGRDQYAPATQRGRRILAHELAHTLQQRSGSPGAARRIQRIPKDPQDMPFEGEIIPWSAALRESPDHRGKVLADLPRGHRVSIQGGHWWILVETVIDGKKLSGYVSHELIRRLPGREAPEETAAEDASKKSAKAVTDTAKKAPEKAADTGSKFSPPVAESPNLTQLKELLDETNVPEDEVIRLMRMLSPGEVAMVASSDWYQKAAVSAFDDEEMINALNAMNLSGVKRHEWMKAEGITVYQIQDQADFKISLEGVSVNSELLNKAKALCQYLIDNNLVKGNINFSEGIRSLSTAHKWSTAYSIRQGIITRQRLEALPDGKDKDGNVWFKKEWSQSEIIDNASEKWSGAMAYEGYPPGDPRRLPNTEDIRLSEHCSGEALDIKIPWRNGDGWHDEAKNLVKQFGLSRPLDGVNRPGKPEHWHFELERGK